MKAAPGDEWIKALEPIGTNAVKEHLTIAPWLIVVFAQRWGQFEDGTRYKNYYVPESVNIATGFLAGRPAQCRAVHPDAHSEPNAVSEHGA